MSVQSSHSASSRSIVRTKEAAMSQTVSTSITRRSVVAGLALAAAPATVLAAADNAHAQDKQTVPEKSLYERLGGVFAIAAVVDHFSDAVVKNPIVGQKSKNPQLREWHTKNLGRLPGLKFMRTLIQRDRNTAHRPSYGEGHVDRIVLFSGDGDFRSLVEAVQRRGVRVTVVSTISSQPPLIADELCRQQLAPK